jgi:WhiB family redox-sensing transcriptional regulator
MTTAMANSEWWRQGACLSAEPDLFFPISSHGAAGGADAARAKRICAGCQVRCECLDYALRTRQVHGIWGGSTEDERRILQNRARKAAARQSGRQQVSSAAS